MVKHSQYLHYKWSSSDDLPAGWMYCYTKPENEEMRLLYLLSPHGKFFKGMVSALKHMKSSVIYSKSNIDQMTSCLEMDGWKSHPLLPTDWKI